jgi:hypothetical protein
MLSRGYLVHVRLHCTNDPDLDTFGILLKTVSRASPCSWNTGLTIKTIEDVHIDTPIQIVNGTLAVDLKRV